MTRIEALVPRTVYLPPAAAAEADRRASEKSITAGTLLRQILLGLDEHLQASRSPEG